MNAKQELLKQLQDIGLSLNDIVCAKLEECAYGKEDKTHLLQYEYNDSDLNKFLDSIDFEYDNGYGCQELEGIVWFNDSWLERGEYDGSEWWEYKKQPQIPTDLLKNN